MTPARPRPRPFPSEKQDVLLAAARFCRKNAEFLLAAAPFLPEKAMATLAAARFRRKSGTFCSPQPVSAGKMQNFCSPQPVSGGKMQKFCSPPSISDGNGAAAGGARSYTIRCINSSRVRRSFMKAPVKAEVVVTEFCFCTPRICMHMCAASITTATPSGFKAS